jgi:AraC-type DNA-binding domain-containing proteins
MTDNYFKYLTHSDEDESCGFYLTVGGYAHVLPDTEYPPKGHPTGYNFNWQKGRILQEYQLNYITDGEGIIETIDGKYTIKAGSVILIKPNCWHRYKPLKNVGWKEHYVGFNSEFAARFLDNSTIFKNSPVVQIGFQDKIIETFYKIFNFIKSEKPGYHQVCTGLLIYILGMIISLKKNEDFQGDDVEKTIQKACLHIRDNLNQNVNIENLSNDLHMSYSIFRRAFKKYTGLSPLQYHLTLRIQQAAYLLGNSNLSVKEISYNLGFGSDFYFRKLFKEKMQITPGEFRRRSIKMLE